MRRTPFSKGGKEMQISIHETESPLFCHFGCHMDEQVR